MNAAQGYALNLFTAIAMITAGYVIALKPRKWLTQARLKQMMSMGAGFLITLLFFELLPMSIRMAGPENFRQVFLGVFGGAATVFIFDRWVAPHLTFFDGKKHEDDGCAHHHEYVHDHGHNHKNITGPAPTHAHAACGHAVLGHGAACSAVGCLIVCAFFDGIAFSGGMVTDPEIGILIFIGQVLHVIPEGLLASTLILASDGLPRTAKKVAVASGSFFLAGAMIPAFGAAMPALHMFSIYILPVSSGILLYVALGQLLPASSGTKVESALVIAGGAAFGILHSLIGHIH